MSFIPIIDNPRYFDFNLPSSTLTNTIQLGELVDLTGAKSAQLVVRSSNYVHAGTVTATVNAYRVWPTDVANGVKPDGTAIMIATVDLTRSPGWVTVTGPFDTSLGRLPGPLVLVTLEVSASAAAAATVALSVAIEATAA